MGFQGKNLGQKYSLLAPYLEDLRNEKSKKENFSNDRERIRKEILKCIIKFLRKVSPP